MQCYWHQLYWEMLSSFQIEENVMAKGREEYKAGVQLRLREDSLQDSYGYVFCVLGHSNKYMKYLKSTQRGM